MFAVAAAVALLARRERRVREACVLLGVAVLPYLALKLGLGLWLDGAGAPVGALELVPFRGLLDLRPFNRLALEQVYAVVAPALLAAAAVAIAAGRRRVSVAPLALWLNLVPYVVLLPAASYAEYAASGRITLGIVVAFVACMPLLAERGLQTIAWIALVLGCRRGTTCCQGHSRRERPAAAPLAGRGRRSRRGAVPRLARLAADRARGGRCGNSRAALARTGGRQPAIELTRRRRGVSRRLRRAVVALHRPRPDRRDGYLDTPEFRYGAFLLPITARLLALGSESVVPLALLLVGLLSAVGGTLALATLLARRSVSPWVGRRLRALSGLFFAFSRDLTEPLAYGLVAAGLLAFETLAGWRRVAAAGLLLALAGLARESALVFAIALAAALLLEREGRVSARLLRSGALLALAIVPLAALKLGLALGLDSTPGPSGGEVPSAVRPRWRR